MPPKKTLKKKGPVSVKSLTKTKKSKKLATKTRSKDVYAFVKQTQKAKPPSGGFLLPVNQALEELVRWQLSALKKWIPKDVSSFVEGRPEYKDLRRKFLEKRLKGLIQRKPTRK